jgi:uncharacterized spore protein YtfJ
MAIETLAETLLEKLRWIAQAETVVGNPFRRAMPPLFR